MDTKTLINEAKARFNHNIAKTHLKDKYDGKLIVAEQGGLWKATPELISFLSAVDSEHVVLVDNFDNTVQVNRKQLLETLVNTYQNVMNQWHTEWKEIESKR